MIPILSRDQMRAFDAHAIEACKVPSLVLMENAGRGAADILVRSALHGDARGKRATIVCGTGNNGGDGFVVARHLRTRGAVVDVRLVGSPEKLTPDCRANHDAYVGLGGSVGTGIDLDRAIAGADVVVDALFGTGLDRAVAEPFAGVIRAVNAAAAPIVALDVPSGMHADTGATLGMAVEATLTVAFAHLKLGHTTPHGARLSGEVHVVDIGVPPLLLADRAASLVEAADVAAVIAPRGVDAHKYTSGHVAIMAGSPGKVGAALLAAHGALRGGAGAATIATWPDAASSLESRVVEIMTARLAEGKGLASSIDAALARKSSVVIGPGFGTDDAARAALRHVIESFDGNIVADADALTLAAKEPETFAAAKAAAILTPHAGELARLLGTTSEAIEADRFAAARTAADRAKAVVLLKGAYTVVASPAGRIVVCGSGHPALATAGSGDVLAGLVGALVCHLPPFEAAYAAAFLHGVAGAAWAKEHGDRGLLAHEIADALPGVLAALSCGAAAPSAR